jgi:hypothetical protein
MPKPTIVVDGTVVGTWRRSFKRDRVAVVLEWFRGFDEGERAAVQAAARRYAEFHSLPVEITLQGLVSECRAKE